MPPSNLLYNFTKQGFVFFYDLTLLGRKLRRPFDRVPILSNLRLPSTSFNVKMRRAVITTLIIMCDFYISLP